RRHARPTLLPPTGCLGRGPLVLPFLFLLAGTVSKLPSFLGQEHSRQDEIYEELSQLKAAVGEFPERSRQEKIYQDMAQLKAAVGEYTVGTQLSRSPGCRPELSGSQPWPPAPTDHLCCPCPWDWTFFQGNCYFFSNSQRNWHDSISACQDVGAQLVVIKGDEEQNFLQLQSSWRNRVSWIGMSDMTQEGSWQWVDGSPLPPSFTKHWNSGEPNNIGEEDCVELFSKGWNDSQCNHAKFWICKMSAASCPSEQGRVPASTAAPTLSAQ
uniref:C-type lectin domain-containing protein n=1 Tax=Microcebus murinus TaxID=30608 RepID=A0A8C5Y5U4_MICMU